MKLTLKQKFISFFIFLSVVGFLLIGVWGYNVIEKRELKSTLSALYQDANYISAAYKVNKGTVSQSLLETMAYSSGAEIIILDNAGNVKTHTGNAILPEKVSGFSPSEGTKGYYFSGTLGDFFTENTVTVFAPLSLSIQPEGYVLLCVPYQDIQSAADSQLLIGFIAYGVLLVLMLLFLLFLRFTVVSPLRKLQEASREFSNGNLTYPLSVNSKDEIGELSRTMTGLAARLNSAGEDQHKFLANITHDFRSPLTSIRGFIVAMQDGTIPPELYPKYMNVVLSESDRLLSLTNGLLDLAQIENGIFLKKTVFDINGLFREIIPTYEGRAEEKHLTFHLLFDAEHSNVYADRDRIQQVLHNLLDNAIKFSHEYSSIDISTALKGSKIFVSVRDHGEGIEKENLPKIWDRFYKTDASRGKNKKGTGLGLPIVREIIQAHRENIDVVSTVGVGTEFIFTLRTAD